MSTQTLEINKNSYVAFDATSLRDLIIERLNKNSVFTDQNYVGSNITAINEIISYSFSTLMFYLNKTSTESMYSEAQLYENINRIVKILDYKPIGYQTASVGFNLTVQNLNVGSYVIPRYSYITIGGIVYSFNVDISFAKVTENLIENISTVNNIYRLYQGRYIEYPLYTATGSQNELILLAVDSTTLVDHFNIDVYVKNYKTGTWYQWKRVDSLYTQTSRDSAYELRLNEDKRYEIKFGDGINGKSLNSLDQVSIFYISSQGASGEIGTNSLNNAFVSKYNSPNYKNILQNILLNYSSIITDTKFSSLQLNNDTESTMFSNIESVEDIRDKAAKNYKSQNRLVTEQDYTTFIKSNFSNFISDVVVKSNNEYLASYIKYFSDIGLSTPQLESRAMYNQVNFANSCNFNNIYVFALPLFSAKSYLMPAQKTAIIESIEPYKTLTADIVVADPVYVAADIAIKSSSITSLQDIEKTEIRIETTKTNKRSNDSIKLDVRSIFNTYFNSSNLTLGPSINVYQIYSDILNIEGIGRVYLRHIDTGVEIEGISLILWNPSYSETDIMTTSQNIILPYFKAVYLNSIDSIINRIKFTTTAASLQSVNY